MDNNNNTATQDFCLTPNGIHPDIEVVISPVFFARPGFDATYQITYRNKGNQTVSGTVNLTFDDSRTDFVSANPLVDNLAVNSLSWNYNNLLPFESRTITVILNVNSPTETPAVNIGDVLNFEVSISPVVADENPLDNTFSYTQTVVGSYDPNDITCLEGDVVPPTEIGNYLHYAINFENTGTFPAENVVVKTEIDAAKFDIGSLQLMNTNFPVDARITGNKVEFIYENIQLPIGGHGHILLKIKTQNTLVTGDAVTNRGDIFFDYNFPIDTGLANTVFQTLSNSVFEVDDSVSGYPNPAVNEVTITADNNIKSIQLYDAQGRIILTRLMDDLESKIELSSYSKGIYFIKITTEKGAQVQKLIKE
ncbi:MAG: T9SS type A sorting domain-containing protein [Flavobacterium sp.]|nr:T9SS type A sorting domain-containing protein [Flavobacterium sp.]